MFREGTRAKVAAAAGCVVAFALSSACTAGNSAKSSTMASASAAGRAAGSARSEPAAAAQVALPYTTGRVDVVTATMSITTRRVDQAADTIATVALAQGGRVDGDQRTAADVAPTATVVVRVPPARLIAVMTAVGRLGTQTSRTVTRDDVTTTKADIDARAGALATSVARLQHLLSTASGVATLLQVEKVLTSRQSDLDALRARQRALDDQVALSTLTVTLVGTTAPPVTRHRHFHATGFGAAVGRSFHGLGVAITVVVAGVGYALPFAVVGGVIVGVVVAGVLLLGRRRRRPGPPATTAVPDSP